MKHLSVLLLCLSPFGSAQAQSLRAGAAVVDITPVTYPVLINGGMTAGTANGSSTPIHARAIALDDGQERLAIVVVDSCMMSREFLDEAKALANQRTGLARDRMLISATHAHSAPASMGCLGTDADPSYIPYLRLKIVEVIERAFANLQPARVGWAVTNAAHYTAVRHWIRRPDRMAEDPFGNLTVRANMHAGRVWDDVTGEGGPEDPDLALLSIQSTSGRPLAVLANFSMHYFSGETPVSADYFGRYAQGLAQVMSPEDSSSNSEQPLVAIMSHGCSGDIWRMDYTKQTPERFESIKIDQYSQELVELTQAALKTIRYDDQATLAMAETRLHLKYRVPDKQRLMWARSVVEKLGNNPPKTTEEVYAREQILLHERQSTDVVVQAVRIGSIAIATTPTETYALTGMKLKLQSPLKQTMVIELANGGDGYIPPPEQHALGGYNTWPARSAGLEVEAEPKIVEACLGLLEKVSLKPRNTTFDRPGSHPQDSDQLDSSVVARYRLNEMNGPRAVDSSPSKLDAIFEPGVVFFLAGPQSKRYGGPAGINRAPHFAGGRLQARLPKLGDHYAVSLWIWNGMPDNSREVAGWFFGRGYNHSVTFAGDALGLSGKGQQAGRLIFQSGSDEPVFGKTVIPRWTWAQVRFERQGSSVKVFLESLDGQPGSSQEPEIEVTVPLSIPDEVEDVFFGGRGNSESSWEGRLDEITVQRLGGTLRR